MIVSVSVSGSGTDGTSVDLVGEGRGFASPFVDDETNQNNAQYTNQTDSSGVHIYGSEQSVSPTVFVPGAAAGNGSNRGRGFTCSNALGRYVTDSDTPWARCNMCICHGANATDVADCAGYCVGDSSSSGGSSGGGVGQGFSSPFVNDNSERSTGAFTTGSSPSSSFINGHGYSCGTADGKHVIASNTHAASCADCVCHHSDGFNAVYVASMVEGCTNYCGIDR